MRTNAGEVQLRYRSRRKRSRFPRLALFVIAIGGLLAFYCAGSGGRNHDPLVKVVEITLGPNVEVRPVLSAGSQNGTETFSGMIDRLKPLAAINGTFYDRKFRPLGDILIDGKLVNRGAYRHAIAITKSGKVSFIRRRNGKFDWSGYRWGLAAGPRLVHEGKIALNATADGFSRSSNFVKAWRSGVGITKDGKLLLVTAKRSLTLKEFAQVMLNLGAVEAMNLDGGGACGLYHKGRTLSYPTLPMTNLLVVYKTK